ncbi:hypothetical protein JCM18899A_39920 [Nocardioides sp. AN3]
MGKDGTSSEQAGLREERMVPVWTGKLGGQQVVGSEVLRSYWTLAAERQRVYHARLQGQPGPWTEDRVVAQYRFTNAYRAADRVSQDLIRVAYSGSQDPQDILFRILLFRFFNKPETWAALEENRGGLHLADFDVEAYARVLDDRLERGERVYSAAYIVPPPPFGERRKHRNHLRLIEHMMGSSLERDLASASSLETVFSHLISYPSLGPFLAFQLTIDLNYSTLIDFDENDFVVAGPGALSGLAKCFPGAARQIDPADLIRMMVETQDEQLDFYGIDFKDLFGRPLKLIDCQNLFCETDKYARVVHPDRRGTGNRTRIKQQFAPRGPLASPFFPPKWGLTPGAPANREKPVRAG